MDNTSSNIATEKKRELTRRRKIAGTNFHDDEDSVQAAIAFRAGIQNNVLVDKRLGFVSSLAQMGEARLCAHCSQILDLAKKDETNTMEFFKFETLEFPSCDFCSVLCWISLKFRPKEELKHALLLINVGGGTFRFDAHHMSLLFEPGPFDLYCITGLPCPWGILPTAPDLCGPSIQERWQMMLQMLYKCLSNHACGAVASSTKMPARVIDIGQANDQMKLKDTKKVRGRYTTLSHCWGDHQPLKTTRDTLKLHLGSLDWNLLPKTFQDAVTVTRLLGLKYIWIDSICIVQDDPDDWVRESRNMGSIYTNSFLTIAASSAHGPSMGLERGESVETMTLSGSTSRGQPYLLKAREKLEHPNRNRRFTQWSLFNRAWIFQERLLSPRVLHFSHPEIIWECKGHSTCECGLVDLLSKATHAKVLQSGTSEELALWWQDLVEDFSKLSLSHDSDKLPALSGLVQQMLKRRTPARYIAGLWSDSMVIELLWCIDDIPEMTKVERWGRTKVWRAPTWSWASMNSAVYFPNSRREYIRDHQERHKMQRFEPHVKILNFLSIPATDDPTGQVSAASLRISGRTWNGKYKISSSGNHQFLMAGSDIRFGVASPRLCYKDPPFDTPILNPEQLICMHIATNELFYPDYEPKLKTEYGLILHCSNAERNEYERVGIVVNFKRLPATKKKWKSCFEYGGVEKVINLV